MQPKTSVQTFSAVIMSGWIVVGIGIQINFVKSVILRIFDFVFCPFHEITGIRCPGCGMTRAFLALSQFRIKEAIQYNPFSIVLFGLLLCQISPWSKKVEILFRKYSVYEILLGVVLTWWVIWRVIPCLSR